MSSEQNLWKTLSNSIESDLKSLRTDVGSLRREIQAIDEDGATLKKKLTDYGDILAFVLAEFSGPLTIWEFTTMEVPESGTESGGEAILSGKKVTEQYLEASIADNAQEVWLITQTYWSIRSAIMQRINALDDAKRKDATEESRSVRGTPRAVWPPRVQMPIRISVPSKAPSIPKIVIPSELLPVQQELSDEQIQPFRASFLDLVDKIIDDCYAILEQGLKKAQPKAGAQLEVETFAYNLLAKLPAPIAYFEKRDIEYPIQSDGLILLSGIGVPLTTVEAIWNALAIVHEVGHDFDNKFALSKYYLRNMISDNLQLSNAVTKEIKEIWLNWLGEIFADVMGVLLLGPWYVYSLFSVILRTHGTNIQVGDDGEHPQPYIRGLIAIKALELIIQRYQPTEQNPPQGFSKEFDRLETLWKQETFIPKIEIVLAGPHNQEYAVEEIVAPMTDYLKLLLFGRIDGDSKDPLIGLESFEGKALLDILTPPPKSIYAELIEGDGEIENWAKRLQNGEIPSKETQLSESPKTSLYILAASYKAFWESKPEWKITSQSLKNLEKKEVTTDVRGVLKELEGQQWSTEREFLDVLDAKLKEQSQETSITENEKSLILKYAHIQQIIHETAKAWLQELQSRNKPPYVFKVTEKCVNKIAENCGCSNEEKGILAKILEERCMPEEGCRNTLTKYCNDVSVTLSDDLLLELLEAAKQPGALIQELKDQALTNPATAKLLKVLKKMVVSLSPGPGTWPRSKPGKKSTHPKNT